MVNARISFISAAAALGLAGCVAAPNNNPALLANPAALEANPQYPGIETVTWTYRSGKISKKECRVDVAEGYEIYPADASSPEVIARFYETTNGSHAYQVGVTGTRPASYLVRGNQVTTTDGKPVSDQDLQLVLQGLKAQFNSCTIELARTPGEYLATAGGLKAGTFMVNRENLVSVELKSASLTLTR